MRERARQPVRSDAPTGRPAARRNLGPAAVLALQRRIGNAAVRQVLARDPKVKPDPLASYRPLDPGPLNLPPQWQNPNVLAKAYPGREAMFRKFVAIYRELELATDKDSKAARDKIKAETDALTGPALQKEVDRLLASTVVPEWLKGQVRDYVGMRYYQDPTTDAGRHGAHHTYYSPVRLMYIIKRESGDWKQAREEEHTTGMSKREQAWLQMSEDNAMTRLIQMHEGKGGMPIPDWAWHEIVRLTPLRSKYAGADWEDLSKEKPATPGDDPVWARIMASWTSPSEKVGQFYGGGTQWRPETLDHQRQVADALVCNELSETTQIKRGVRLPGGIRKNAEYFAKAAVDGAKAGAAPEIAGSYFKKVESLGDLRPGASLFWINTTWQKKPKWGSFDNSNMVFPVDGVDWPMPFPPEFVKEWSDWDAARKKKAAWDRKPKGDDPGDPGDEPTYDRTTLPGDGEEVDGWRYTVTPGQGITRTEVTPDGDGETQWMTWLHQATVLRAMPDGRIFVLETTLLDPKDQNSGVTGFTQHGLTKRDLLSGYVWVGYIPGRADASAARP